MTNLAVDAERATARDPGWIADDVSRCYEALPWIRRNLSLLANLVDPDVCAGTAPAPEPVSEARRPRSPRLGRWQQVLTDALNQNLAIGVRAAVADHLGRAPTRAELTAARRAAHSLATLGRAQVLQVPGTDTNDNSGDRNYLVLAKPNVIMNDVRLRGLGVAGSNAAGRKTVHNHAQSARNLRRTLRSAAVGARLIQAEALDDKSAADLATSLADALDELHRLKRSLDRRIRRDQAGPDG